MTFHAPASLAFDLLEAQRGSQDARTSRISPLLIRRPLTASTKLNVLRKFSSGCGPAEMGPRKRAQACRVLALVSKGFSNRSSLVTASVA